MLGALLDGVAVEVEHDVVRGDGDRGEEPNAIRRRIVLRDHGAGRGEVVGAAGQELGEQRGTGIERIDWHRPLQGLRHRQRDLPVLHGCSEGRRRVRIERDVLSQPVDDGFVDDVGAVREIGVGERGDCRVGTGRARHRRNGGQHPEPDRRRHERRQQANAASSCELRHLSSPSPPTRHRSPRRGEDPIPIPTLENVGFPSMGQVAHKRSWPALRCGSRAIEPARW